MQPTENWLAVPGYEHYEVSDHGQVRSVRRGIVLQPSIVDGYARVTLRRGGVPKQRPVHQLVLEAFVGPRPAGWESCHGDGDRLNCAVSNLRWGTHAENMQDKILHGRNHELAKTHCDHGHEFTPANTYRWAGQPTQRKCKTCRRERLSEMRSRRQLEAA